MKKKYKNQAERQEVYRERVRERTGIQSADEWTWNWDSRYPEQAAEVCEYVRSIQRKVAEEIGYSQTFQTTGSSREKYAEMFPLGHHPGEETVDYVARTLYAFRQDTPVWVRKVSEGIITAGSYFPDGLGDMIVYGTHKYNLELSPTYSALYRELLSILDQRFGNNHDPDSEAVKQELAGTFPLPVEPHVDL